MICHHSSVCRNFNILGKKKLLAQKKQEIKISISAYSFSKFILMNWTIQDIQFGGGIYYLVSS